MSHKLHTSFDGSLLRTDSARTIILRENYSRHHREIKTVADLKATLRAGAYAWPGGYPLAYFTSDGAVLAPGTVRECLGEVIHSIRHNCDDGWRVVACDVLWEGEHYDDHTGEKLETAYGD